MSGNLDLERQKRLQKTGKWFEGSSSTKNKDFYLTYILPLLLIFSLCFTCIYSTYGLD